MNDNDILDDHDEFASSSSALPLSIDDGYHDSDLENDLIEDDDDDETNDNYRHPTNKIPTYAPPLFLHRPHLAVLPVLLLEFLALALTRAVLPSLLLKRYGSRTYIVMGAAECVRGMLAFFACPLFGKLSDVWGRRPCLLITVMGTLAPVCSMAFWRMDHTVHSHEGGVVEMGGGIDESTMNAIKEDTSVLDGTVVGEASEGSWAPTYGAEAGYFSTGLTDTSSFHRIDVFVTLLALSGVFSSTFTLTFAYISDVVKDRDGRVAAYGLALATFGLSFTIGPLLGGYLANVNDEGKGQGGRNWMKMFHMDSDESNEWGKDSHSGGHLQYESKSSDIHPLGQHRVFVTTLILAVLDLLYIHFILPESLNDKKDELEHESGLIDISVDRGAGDDAGNDTPSSTAVAATSSTSNIPLPAGIGVSRRASSSWWNPFDSIRYLTSDPLLSTIGRVTFLYYTSLHAVVSTLILYATRQFHLGPHRLGELMAALGLSTMISEAVLVRIAIPALGEKRAMRVGLATFAMQCVLLAVADSPWHLFVCAALAIPGNLVYPSVSSLVSTSVRPEMVGRALGAVNGLKSLTEGVGPLVFGTLLTMSENDALPGWPYFIAAIMATMAFRVGRALPGDTDEDNSFSDSYGQVKRGTGRGNSGSINGSYRLKLREEDETRDLLDRQG